MLLFAWDGFPQYAARCIGALVKSTIEKVVVVSTRPDVPIEGMEQCCHCPVIWVGYDDTRKLSELLDEMPRLLIVSGWSIRVFNRYRDEVRRAGGRVVAMCDNNWEFPTVRSYFSLRFAKECLKALRFRLKIRGQYDAFFVPGKSGQRLMRFYGAPTDKTLTGMYAADASLFQNGKPLPEREKKIIYVGRLNARKNVLRLVRAFQSLAPRFSGWSLDLYGAGPLKDELLQMTQKTKPTTLQLQLSTSTLQTTIHSFVQPAELAALYQSARIFILPSLWEHWGLVVHEAALSGCVLLLGNRTGAAEDLLGSANGRAFDPYSEDAIAGALAWAMQRTDDELRAAQEESLRLAQTVSIGHFVESVKSM